jgi:hypothetical protein
MFLLSTTRLEKSSTHLVHNPSPFGNELIKHNPREECDAIHEMKIRVLHKVYKQVFKQLYSSLCQDLRNKSETLQKKQVNKHLISNLLILSSQVISRYILKYLEMENWFII